MLKASPVRKTRLVVILRASAAPSSDVAMAVTTCGRNMTPYWVLDSPYPLLLVRIVLTAGSVITETCCQAVSGRLAVLC